MLNTAVAWELMSQNPFREVKNVKVKEQDFDFWKPDERDEFLDRCYEVDPDFADAVLVACHTGLRVGELAGLNWRAIDFDRRTMAVKDTFNFKLNKRFHRTKTHDKAIHLPLNDLVLEVFTRRRSNVKTDGSVFSEELLRWSCKRLQRLCRKFGSRELRFHDLRHTFASCLAMAGADLMVIQKLMRHQSYQMTLRYAHLHPDHLRGATDILVSRGRDSVHALKVGISCRPRIAHETQSGKLLSLAALRSCLVSSMSS